jgi:hypothetical protein
MSDEIVARMIAGYGLVATLVEQGHRALRPWQRQPLARAERAGPVR